ncbi:MAG TPA: L,D-transpeptidase family protein [Longimicrobiales bacterium]
MRWSWRPLTFALALAPVACVHAQHAARPGPERALADATQLIVVTTSGWDSITGELHRFVRSDATAAWRSAGSAVPIVVGRTGLAWGVGFDRVGEASEPHKREGDGRSPAGIFTVRTAFGFAPVDSVHGLKLSYMPLTTLTECVDDTASAHYNTVLERSSVLNVDWHSSERMRQVGQYRVGAIIDYNATPPVKGRGSCIFFHIWGGPRAPTVGCTALDARELQQLLAWLDPRAQPVVVQLPAVVYGRLRAEWRLPAW